MNKINSGILGGFAGAVALNILHQVVKQFDHEAPRVDLIGEEALSKGLKKIGVEPPVGDTLFAATMAADLVSNAAYYSLIGLSRKKHLPYVGATVGLAAGVGALSLTKTFGLSDAPVNRTGKTKLLTVAWYTFGGIVTSFVIKALRK